MAITKALLALALLGSSGIAAAHPDHNASAPSPSDSAWTRYCMKVEPVTGSRVETVECWTRAEWTEQGVDLDKDWEKEGVSVVS